MSQFANRVGFMKPSAIREAGKMIGGKKGCISFAGGLPAADVMPLREMGKICEIVLSEVGTNSVQYGLTKGTPALIEEIVKMLEKKGILTDKENIQVTTGSQQGIFLSGMLLLNEGDTVVVENPTYLGALTSFAPLGCNYIGIDADDDGMKLELLKMELEKENTIKFVYVVPNFSNPTGKEWSLDKRKYLLELAEKYDFMIVEDDPYGNIRFDGEELPSIKSMDKNGKVIYLGSFSKILYAGLRVGFTVSTEEIANNFELFKQGIDLQSNEFAQNQIACFLRNYDLEKQVEHIVKSYKAKRDLMIEAINVHFPSAVKIVVPKGGMFVWCELPDHVDTFELLKECIEEANVGYVPGGPFFAVEGKKNTMRLNFSSVEKDKIEPGIMSLGNFLKKHC